MNSGILIAGIFTLFASEPSGVGELRPVFSFLGLVGGGMWALGNLCTVPIIQSVGLGIGLPTWGGTSLVISFVLGRLTICFGATCLEPDGLTLPWLAAVGCALSILSLVLFGAVKPTVKASVGEETKLVGGEEEPSPQSDSQRTRGLLLALVAGLLYGFQFLPAAMYSQMHPEQYGLLATIRFFFSQWCGSFLVSIVAYATYAAQAAVREQPIADVPLEAMMPSIGSGILWAVAGAGAIIATDSLGLSIGYPLALNGSFLVNMCWALFYYKEVQGAANLWLYAGAAACSVLGSVFLSVAR